MPDIESKEKNPSQGNFLEKLLLLPRTFFRVHQRNLGRASCEEKKKTRELIFTAIPPYLLSSEVLIESWDKGHAFPRRHVTRLSRKVYSPRGWRVEREKRKKEWERERERRGASWLSETLALLPATVSTGETRSNGIKKPLRDRDCSRLTVSHPSPYLVRVTPLDSTSQIAPPQRQWWLCYRSPRHS